MENINIIELIEKNPIAKLSNTYNNKLLKKIKENFNKDEQKLFISSFYCYLNYNQITDFIIDLDDIWKWLGFSQKVNAKRVLEKNFVKDTDYKISLCNLAKQDKSHGGNNKEIIMLNIETFKLFCMETNTIKSKEIQKYYVKLERILQETLDEQAQEFSNYIKSIEIKTIKEKEIDRHNIKLNDFDIAGPLVYLLKVKTFDDKSFILKIGESGKGVGGRYDEHKSSYEESIILDCYPVNQSKQFESFLHSHPEIKPLLYKKLKGHENEKELFFIENEIVYNKIVKIIKENINSYKDNGNLVAEIEKLKLENENLKLTNNMKTPDNIYLKELIEQNKKILEKFDNLEKKNQELVEKINSIQVKNVTTTNFGEVNKNVGQKLQKINPDTLTLIKTYDCVAEVLKENPKLKRSSITKAIGENTIYQGFRWLFIDRELDSTKINKIEPTKETRQQNTGYIAKLNKEKTQILNVYLDRKTACNKNGYKSDSALDNPVKKFTETNDHYYILYDSCSKVLKDSFEKQKGKPILYKSGIGQYNEKNKLVGEFTSKQECCISVGIGDKSLKKSLDNKVAYNGFLYKYMDEKLVC
jgi:hypothetical protein